MLYKKYDLIPNIDSEGKQTWIARNQVGAVAFRAPTLEQLKKEIDRFEKEEEERRLARQKIKSQKKNKKLTSKTPESQTSKEKSEKTASSLGTPQSPSSTKKSPPRGPNGKFISQKGQENEEQKTASQKKKSFWDKLVG